MEDGRSGRAFESAHRSFPPGCGDIARAPTLLLSIAACFASGILRAEDAPSASFRDCEALVQVHPESLDSYDCFYLTAKRTKAWARARQRLDSLLRQDPSNHRARRTLARIAAARGDEDAEQLYRAAVDGLAAQNDAGAEVVARTELCTFLWKRGRFEEARGEVEKAAAVAEHSADPMLIARASIERGFLEWEMSEHGPAWTAFSSAARVVFPNGPSELQCWVLEGMGGVCVATGRYREAFECLRHEATLLERIGDPFNESLARYNMATIAWDLVATGEMDSEEARRSTRHALEAAIRVGNWDAEASARALLTIDPDLDPRRAIEEVTKALAGHRRGGRLDCIIWDLDRLALALLEAFPEEPERAYRSVDEAIELARSHGAISLLADARLTRGTLSRHTASPAEVIAEYEAAFEAVEALRDLQRDDVVRAGCFSPYTPTYYQLAGYLLSKVTGPDIDTAFRTVERMRARVLLDHLDASKATPVLLPDDPLARRRTKVLDQIAQVQRRLLEAGLPPKSRADALEEVDRLEVEERALRDEMARADPGFRNVRCPTLATLSDIRLALGPDEALLSYQLPSRVPDLNEDDGGSWLIAVTREQTRAYPLPDRKETVPAVELFLGMFDRRDDAEARAAARLFRLLLAPATRDLPASKTRLIVIPDGILHQLPFDALRCHGPRHEFVTNHYSITLAPSASVWLRLRNAGNAQATHPAVVLADPALLRPGSGPVSSEQKERLWTLEWLGPMGGLPSARAEGRAVRKWLGRDCLLLEGSAATERALKRIDLNRFRILHFATHTILDDARPDRSAILLAAGSAREDGLLQTREIVGMRMAGQLVVLASCRSASGTLLPGEGVMGIARAFLQAGASVVVGSLWPLRDAEARRFFGAFYERIRNGTDVAAAAAGARRDCVDRHTPAAAWAGVVVIGNGRLTPFPDGCPDESATWWPVGPLLAIGLLIAVLAASRARSIR
ncbi:MAG: CHAT domain-containing protein [Acidobacteriota bacterium]